MELTLQSWSLFLLSAAIVGFTKTSVGGMGILAVVSMALAFPGKASPGILLPMLVFADLLAVLYYRRSTDWSILLRIMPAAAIGVAAGYFIVDLLPAEHFNRVIGGIILALVALGWVFERNKHLFQKGPTMALAFGVIAGAASMISNAAGPIFAIYLLQLGLNKETFVGTRSCFFIVINFFTHLFPAGLGLITAETLELNLIAVPIIVAGAIGGDFFLRLLDLRFFNILVKITAIIAGFRLVAG